MRTILYASGLKLTDIEIEDFKDLYVDLSKLEALPNQELDPDSVAKLKDIEFYLRQISVSGLPKDPKYAVIDHIRAKTIEDDQKTEFGIREDKYTRADLEEL